MKKAVLVTALLLMAAVTGAQVNDSAGIIFPLLDIGIGARALAMGEAFTAAADDVSSVFWNPAGLVKVKAIEVEITYNKWFMDSYYQSLLAAFPLTIGTIGFDIFYMGGGMFEQREESGVLLPEYLYPYSFGNTVSLAINTTENMHTGIGVKMMYQNIGDSGYFGAAIDMGIIVDFKKVSAGMMIQNLGIAGEFDLPVNIKGGVSFKPLEPGENTLIFSMDVEAIINDTVAIMAGAEYSYDDTVFARVGYKHKFTDLHIDGFSGLSFGAGLSAGLLRMQYAFVPYGDLGFTHRMSLVMNFGDREMKKKDEIAEEKAAEEEPEETVKFDTKKLFTEALDLEIRGKLKEAALKFTEIIKVEKNNDLAWKRLGFLYYRMNKKEYAIKCFETAIKIKPNKALEHWLLEYRWER